MTMTNELAATLLEYRLRLRWVNYRYPDTKVYITLSQIKNSSQSSSLMFFTDIKAIYFSTTKDKVLFYEFVNASFLTDDQFNCLKKAWYLEGTLVNPENCDECFNLVK